MLPPSQTRLPACLRNSAISVVVVVLPSEPVTAMILQGQTRKKASISDVMTAPDRFRATSSGRLGCRPGVRKTTSPDRSSR